MCKFGLNSHGSEVGCCGGSEHNNGLSGSIKCGEFLGWHINSTFAKKQFGECTYGVRYGGSELCGLGQKQKIKADSHVWSWGVKTYNALHTRPFQLLGGKLWNGNFGSSFLTFQRSEKRGYEEFVFWDIRLCSLLKLCLPPASFLFLACLAFQF